MQSTLSHLILQGARRRPEHVAVEDETGALTYRDLVDLASRIASALSPSVRLGDRVGVLMTKCRETVAALYGVMWAGAAYVPLDAGSPPARLAAMIQDSGMAALITTAGQANRLLAGGADFSSCCVVLLDGEPTDVAHGQRMGRVVGRAEVDGAAPMDEPAELRPDALAYVLYTSGSTGAPKGVMISQRNALAFIEWACETIGVTGEDRLSSHAPFHFDLSVFDLYATAMAQATVCIVPDGVSAFPVRLAEWIESRRISVWYSVPSVLVQLWDRGRIDRFKFDRLRSVCFAGEVFATKYLRNWMQAYPRLRWYNLYGPTETNVCTWYSPQTPPVDDAPIPIGTAASGAVIQLLDESGRAIVQAGVEGEIWVDGPTVALGYWGDTTKTRERFVALPQLTGHDRALYRTGDLASRRESGELVFHGRRDSMIKSRGYRIELGEVEAALHGHSAVQEACAVAIPDAEIGHRIRACVVRHRGIQLDCAALERFLGERIPRYMLPSEIEFLDALPRTSNGKVDRVALAGKSLQPKT